MKPQLTERSERKLHRLNATLDILPVGQVYYAYILQCRNGSKYYGHTNQLLERFKAHRNGRIASTRAKHPELVYFEEFTSRSEAFRREMQFKNGRTRKSTLEKLIASFPKAKCQGFNSRSDLTSLTLRKSRAH